jgi:type I restriction enzyme S subunit
LDDKIAINTKINKNLEALANSYFELLIKESTDQPLGILADIAEINPPRNLKRGNYAVYIEMSNLPTTGSFPTDWEQRKFSGGMKFSNGDTIMARITPCLENGKTAHINFLDDGKVAFGSTEYIVIAPKPDYCHEMFYFLARNADFISYAVRNMNGSSGRQRVSAETIGQYSLPLPTKDKVARFAQFVGPVMELIKYNSLEIRRLIAIRDALLPRLMSGEISAINTDK